MEKRGKLVCFRDFLNECLKGEERDPKERRRVSNRTVLLRGYSGSAPELLLLGRPVMCVGWGSNRKVAER